MSGYMNEEMFKTVRRGGYDREDVEQHFQRVKDEAAEEKNKLLLVLRNKEKKIGELTEQLGEKDKEIQRLENEVRQLHKDINEKYKTYIDNYDTIGQLIYDARIRANQMISDAENESSRLIRNAQAESERILENAKKSADVQLGRAQSEMDAKIQDGRRNYAAIQDEINELVQQVNQIQRKFIQSIKSIHEISDSVLDVRIEESEYDDSDHPMELPSPEDESRFVKEAMAMKDYENLDDYDDSDEQ